MIQRGVPFFLLLAACETASTEPVRAPIPPLLADGVVLTSVVTRAPDPLPERFTVPPERWFEVPPPLGKIRVALCTDQPGVRDAVLAGLRSAPEPFDGFDPSCREPGWCEWVGTVLAADPANPALSGLWWATASCPELTRLVNTSGPPSVVFDRAARSGTWDPRLEAIAFDSLEQPGFGFEWVLGALASIDDPAAERTLLALHRKAPQARRDAIALSMWGRSSPEAVAAFREVCRRIEDDRCNYVRTDPLSNLIGSMADGTADPETLFARYPNHRRAVMAALTDCVEEGAGRPCLVALAREDRAAAARLVTRRNGGLPSGRDPALADLAKVLAEDRVAVLQSLTDLGFPPLAVPAGSTAVTVPELLQASGYAARIDDPMAWPPHHEQLLYTIAGIVGGGDLAFDELLPSPAAPPIDGRNPAITLYAWTDGWRYRTLVPAVEGWDVPAAVGFVNALLDGSFRVALDADQQYVIAGPPEALAALEDDGWLQLYRPPPPEAGDTVTPIVGDPVILEPTDGE